MTPVRKQIRLALLTTVCDALAIFTSFLVAYLVRFLSGVIPRTHIPPFEIYFKAAFVVIPVYLWLFRAYGLYDPRRSIRRVEEIFRVLKAVTFAVLILTAITFFYREWSYSRLYLLLMWFLSAIFVSLSRYLLIQWEYHRKKQKHDITRVLLVGANRNARQIIRWAKTNPHYGHEIIGVLAQETPDVGKHFEEVPILGISEQCENFINHLKPAQVVLLDPVLTRNQITEIVALCEDQFIEVKIAADFIGLMTRNLDIDYISTVPLLGFHALPLDDVWNRFMKRSFDLILALILLLLTFPVWVLAILAIKADDGGPIFYQQERIGRDLLIFKLLKFRTMKTDAEKETGPVWAKPNDRRRTRVGNFLRRWNIDELPQLLNVLMGNMSLVGPRPERSHFIDQFRMAIPRYMTRHKVKSGLTGWAQVNGFRGNTSIQERLKYDLYYLENWSLLFDIEILFYDICRFQKCLLTTKEDRLNKIPVSIAIIAKNEEKRLPDCLRSVSWAEEVIVLDDMSTDRTTEIAKKFSAKVFQHPMDIEGRQRNYAYEKATQPWVLSLDADERVTPELAEEIARTVREDKGEYVCYSIPIKTFIGHEWIQGAGYYPAPKTRFFRKGQFRYEDARVHPRVFYEGKCGHLRGDILHYSCQTLEQWIGKFNRETTLEADKWIQDGRKVRLASSLRKTVDRFLKNYFLKKGWRYGFMGFLMSVFHGLYQLFSYAKYREMKLALETAQKNQTHDAKKNHG